MSGPWREPAAETEGLYPDLVVMDNRVSGSITTGRSRLPLWAFVWPALTHGWDEAERGWSPSEYGWTADKMGEFLYHLLEARGEFGRLLLVLAEAERTENEMGDPWWHDDAGRERVAEQLRRCLAVLTPSEPAREES